MPTTNGVWGRVLPDQTNPSGSTCQAPLRKGNYTTKAAAYNAVTWNVALNGSTKHLSHSMAALTAGVTIDFFEALPRHRAKWHSSASTSN